MGEPAFRDDGLPDCSTYCSQRCAIVGISIIISIGLNKNLKYKKFTDLIT